MISRLSAPATDLRQVNDYGVVPFNKGRTLVELAGDRNGQWVWQHVLGAVNALLRDREDGGGEVAK